MNQPTSTSTNSISGAPPADSSASATSSDQQRIHDGSMSEDSMETSHFRASGPQPIGKARAKTGKRPKKLKVRHLSELTKRIIVERFEALLDHDEVADSMDVAGLTGKTVANVLDAFRLDTRKPPAREVAFGVGQQRRSA